MTEGTALNHRRNPYRVIERAFRVRRRRALGRAGPR